MENIKIIAGFLSAALFCGMFSVLPASAEAAAEYTASAQMVASSGYNTNVMRDGKEGTVYTFAPGGTLTITASGPIAGVSVKFDKKPALWHVSAGETQLDCGQHAFLHDYADIASLGASQIVLTFDAYVSVSEIRIFGAGDLPADVQVWEPEYEKADIALFSTHNDDEHLFFLGLIPDAIARGKKMQVVYFCHHNGEPVRLHETLNALWEVGLRHYPAMGRFPDQYSENLQWAKNNFTNAGISYDSVVAYQVEMLRRFKPDVVVGHDVNGEYGHGQHRYNTETLRKALEISADAAQYPQSAALYGTWNVPKTYLHLWAQNPLTMHYDTPLEYFGGRTAYEVSKAGYAKHNSQQYTWFTGWLKGGGYTKASQITTYSPLKYGLYRSTVGLDTGINDMFEHIVTEYIKGDPDGDGAVTVADAQLVLEAAVHLTAGLESGLTDAQTDAADTDCDGALTVADAQLILAYYTVNTVSEAAADWSEIVF
ncbi:MAG: PIG-L family deacetylase [Oscillospiraceae bacterium]|nr:PIG-L family deacetylase [Oscillospiraceae bacterium]